MTRPAYEARFHEVFKFHAPGLAPVSDSSGAFHVDTAGRPAYRQRYIRTFGLYEGLAAVQSEQGWRHIGQDGSAPYSERYAWCGNFQEGRSVVRYMDGLYSHIRKDGKPSYAPRYRYVGDYRDGIAVVQRDDGLHTHADLDGNLTHRKWFLDLDVFHKRYARARDEQGWHHIDANGEPAYQHRFTAVEPFYNGQARVEGLDGSLMVIDEAGDAQITLRPPRTSPVEELSSDMVGFWRTQTIAAAVDLGVFEVLPGRSAEIAERTGVPEKTIARLMRALAEIRLVDRNDRQGWAPTERGLLLSSSHRLSMASAARLWGAEHYLAWAGLGKALRNGTPAFDGQLGKPFFDWLQDRPAQLAVYHDAMSSYGRHDYEALPEIVDFSKHLAVLDAGGGRGELMFSLLRANPNLRGIVFDRPEVVADTRIPSVLAARCSVVAGDLFAAWPVHVDAVVLARVLHDWPDAEALRILGRARDAIEADGLLYVVDLVLDEESGSGGLLDLNMLLMTGGKERTIREYEELLKATGFNLLEMRKTPSVSSVIIARPS